MDFKTRFKNPWFWVGLLGIILSAMKISPETLTSWEIVKYQFFNLIKNPYMLACVFVSVLGVFIDPTTKGIKDRKNN